MLKLCTIHHAFNRGCFEAILIENTCRTLGINWIIEPFVIDRHVINSQIIFQ